MKIFLKILLKMFVFSILMTIAIILLEIDTNAYVKTRTIVFIILVVISFILFISIIVEYIYIIFKETKKRKQNVNKDFNNLENVFYEAKYNIENTRKETVYSLIIMIAVFFALAVCNIAFMKINLLLRIILFVLSLLIFVKTAMKYEYKKQIYTKLYKETIISAILKEININLKYTPDGDEDNFKRFLDAGYIEPPYNKHIITDTISLNSKNEFYVINKIKLIMKNSRGRRYLTDIFMFSYNKIDKNIPLTISIKKNNKQTNEPINMNNFKKYFDVEYDNIDFNYKNQLIDNILKNIIEYYNKYSITLNIKIMNNNLFIKFYTGDILETPFLLKNVKDFNTVESNYKMIFGIIEICDKLKKVIEKNEV